MKEFKIKLEDVKIMSVSAGGKCVICDHWGELILGKVYANLAQAKSILRIPNIEKCFRQQGYSVEQVRKYYNYLQKQ